jgi:tetratricopeptide (TPR) repeat protein
VVGCTTEELAYVAKFLQGLDEALPADFVLVLSSAFHGTVAYVDDLVAGLQTQLAACNSIRAERGQEPFRPLPPAVLDGSAAPERRLRDLLHYFPTLVPAAGDHHIVVGLLPIECTDFGGYAHLLASAATASELSAGLRLVIYDERLDKRLGPRLRALGTERLVTFDVDFSTPALTQELLIASADASLPLTERMSSLLQLAAIDFAYKRYPSAIEKYAALYDYYEREELGQMQALCLVGAGDALRGSGDRRAAMQMLQRGLALAGKHAALAVLLNGLLSISEVCAELGSTRTLTPISTSVRATLNAPRASSSRP